MAQAKITNIAAIILAAGQSSRLGLVKQTLPWGKKNIVNTCVETAWAAELDPLVVVLGANRDMILPLLDQEGVIIVENERWAEGQSTSLKAGLRALPETVRGALFLLADQPQISVNLISSLIEIAADEDSVVLPIITGRRANPVYFPRSAFDELDKLEGDQGGRSVISCFPVRLLEWLDDDMAGDIDTLEDYQKMRARFGLG
ncbi:MAG: nucleotidyltransferase family protein [Anaerolineaceae bacterium]